MNEKIISDITLYTLKLIDQTISPKEFDELNSIISSNVEAARCYNQLRMIICNFQEIGQELSLDDSMANDTVQKEFWKSLAEYEKEAPQVEIIPSQEANVLVEKVYLQKMNRKISKRPLFTLVAAVAAIILIFVFARFVPPATGIKVAVLSDSIKAKWVDADGTMGKGTAILTSRKNLQLKEGFVQLLFDNQAQVTIEGPAAFQIQAEDKISLQYGKLYAMVPSKAIGFIVMTQSARVIDLGTEFGVCASLNGVTELHVYKGKTTLIAGTDQDNKQVTEVVAGNARRIHYGSPQIDDISLKETLFARDIDSSRQFIWMGRPLNLASVVAGGDGFTHGQVTIGIDPATGGVHMESVQGFNRIGGKDYKGVPDRTCIDGVFVPNGIHGKNVITSAGHSFVFPRTDGNYYSDITSNPYVRKEVTKEKIRLSLKHTAAEETADSSVVFIHPNAGITIDLDRIRQSLGQMEISRFKSVCGVSQLAHQTNQFEFWVLVDGNCVFHYKRDQDVFGGREIDVPLKSQDQFLTLAVTDGGDGINYDWCIFEEPRLSLENKP
jgi:hypothetical protein